MAGNDQIPARHSGRLAAGVRHLRSADRRMAGLIAAVGPCRLAPGDGDVYRSLFRAVIAQQLAGGAAAAIEGRVRELFRGRIPAPGRFLAVSDEALRAAGLSGRKIGYLRELADRVARGGLNVRRLRSSSDEEIVAAVTSLRGIGEWTAHMLLLFGLGRPDVLPVGDYGVRKAVQRVYGLAELPDRAGLTALAEPWRPYRSVASWYLWRSLDTPSDGR